MAKFAILIRKKELALTHLLLFFFWFFFGFWFLVLLFDKLMFSFFFSPLHACLVVFWLFAAIFPRHGAGVKGGSHCTHDT